MTIYKADPDVIIGFEFLGVSLDVLLNRMRDLKADHWSRLGRFRRSKFPIIGRQGTNIKFLDGRLLCDLTSDGAKVSAPSKIFRRDHVLTLIPEHDFFHHMVPD